MQDQDYQEVANPVIHNHPYPNIERLICLAMADEVFATRLLADPKAALQDLPPAFQLSSSEERIMLSVPDAPDLETFSAQIYKQIVQTSGGSEEEPAGGCT